MNCDKCGKELSPYFEHTCVEAAVLSHNPSPNFNTPTFQPQTSSVLEKVTITISKNSSTLLNPEEFTKQPRSYGGFLKELKQIIGLWKETYKKPSKENIIVLITGISFFVLWIVTSFIPGDFRYMVPSGIKAPLAILFASFNNVPARVLHFSSLLTLAAAFIPAALSGKIGKITGTATSSFKLFQKLLSYQKSASFGVLILFAGLGMAFSNFLMRNNAINKYAVCFTLGTTVIFATSGLLNSTFIRLSDGLISDLAKLFKLSSAFETYRLPMQMGFGVGLLASILGSLFRTVSHSYISDYICYILGILIGIAGVVLILLRNPSDKKEQRL